MTAAEEPGFDLVMPFVTVASRGGPHDDASYAAGWEMGALDYELSITARRKVERLIHAVNAPQVDLIAMKHGYRCTVTEHDEEWSWLTLERPAIVRPVST